MYLYIYIFFFSEHGRFANPSELTTVPSIFFPPDFVKSACLWDVLFLKKRTLPKSNI